MTGWVYYVPELEALCICYPYYMDFETQNSPLEWSPLDFYKLVEGFYLDARIDSPKRNAFYIGEL